MSLIISFDLGFKNMGMCVLNDNYDNYCIVEWQNLKIDSSSVREIVNVLEIWISLLCTAQEDNVTVVLERQPWYNRKTSRLLVIMETYFTVTRPSFNIVKVLSNSKWKFLGMPVPTSYNNRKRDAIIACQKQMEIYEPKDSKWKVWFDKERKRDDLADCYLQGLVLRNRK